MKIAILSLLFGCLLIKNSQKPINIEHTTFCIEDYHGAQIYLDPKRPAILIMYQPISCWGCYKQIDAFLFAHKRKLTKFQILIHSNLDSNIFNRLSVRNRFSDFRYFNKYIFSFDARKYLKCSFEDSNRVFLKYKNISYPSIIAIKQGSVELLDGKYFFDGDKMNNKLLNKFLFD